jgi:putative PIN family toxin of toxin-antitoxin system
LSVPLVVVDTSVVIAHLTAAPEDTPNGMILRACGTGSLRVALSDAALKELTEVVERLDRRRQITSASRALRAAIDLWSHGILLHPDRLDRPTVVDRKDHWVLDLAWAATADFIISLDPDLTEPTMPFPVEVLEPDELLTRLVL